MDSFLNTHIPLANKNSPIIRRKRGRAVCVENTQERFWIAYADGLYFYENVY